MIILSVFIALLAISVYMIIRGVRTHNSDYKCFGSLGAFVIMLMNIISFATSFHTAVRVDIIREGLISEYRTAITVYEDKAVLKIEDLALTDLKYQGYQENMVELIKDVRRLVHEHNYILISKRAMKKNIFFNVYISMPDEDQLIHIVEK